jgi:hypothetical protein
MWWWEVIRNIQFVSKKAPYGYRPGGVFSFYLVMIFKGKDCIGKGVVLLPPLQGFEAFPAYTPGCARFAHLPGATIVRPLRGLLRKNYR